MKFNKKPGELSFTKKAETLELLPISQVIAEPQVTQEICEKLTNEENVIYKNDSKAFLEKIHTPIQPKSEKLIVGDFVSAEKIAENDEILTENKIDFKQLSEKTCTPIRSNSEKSIVGDFDFSEPKFVEKVENSQIEKLNSQRADFQKSLEAMKKIKFQPKVEFYEKQISDIDLMIERLQKEDKKILSTAIQVIEERAGILEYESGMEKAEATEKAILEVDVTKYSKSAEQKLNADLIEYWKKMFGESEALREIDIVEVMLNEKDLKSTPANITKMINEIFRAELLGYIENTCNYKFSSHIYRKAG